MYIHAYLVNPAIFLLPQGPLKLSKGPLKKAFKSFTLPNHWEHCLNLVSVSTIIIAGREKSGMSEGDY